VKHPHQRGVALLVAIVMFALSTTVAAAITYNKAMAARRAAATFTLEQALQAGMAAEALAGIALEEDGTNAKTEIHEPWAQMFGPLEIEGTGIWIQAQVEDLTSRFNLNSVVAWQGPPLNTYKIDPLQADVFRDLLDRLNIDARYADLLVDWIDPDTVPESLGGEDSMYLTQTPPYRPPNTFIWHTSELLALPSFGSENYAKIAPYVSALPVDEKINVCTASGVVLDAVESLGQTGYANQDLAQQREKGCFPTQQVYLDAIGDPNTKSEVQKRVFEKSSWFRLRTNIRIGTAEFVLYSVLFREANNRVRTVQRSFGNE
jgi:general secretion pathway protein K